MIHPAVSQIDSRGEITATLIDPTDRGSDPSAHDPRCCSHLLGLGEAKAEDGGVGVLVLAEVVETE